MRLSFAVLTVTANVNTLLTSCQWIFFGQGVALGDGMGRCTLLNPFWLFRHGNLGTGLRVWQRIFAQQSMVGRCIELRRKGPMPQIFLQPGGCLHAIVPQTVRSRASWEDAEVRVQLLRWSAETALMSFIFLITNKLSTMCVEKFDRHRSQQETAWRSGLRGTERQNSMKTACLQAVNHLTNHECFRFRRQ